MRRVRSSLSHVLTVGGDELVQICSIGVGGNGAALFWALLSLEAKHPMAAVGTSHQDSSSGGSFAVEEVIREAFQFCPA